MSEQFAPIPGEPYAKSAISWVRQRFMGEKIDIFKDSDDDFKKKMRTLEKDTASLSLEYRAVLAGVLTSPEQIFVGAPFLTGKAKQRYDDYYRFVLDSVQNEKRNHPERTRPIEVSVQKDGAADVLTERMSLIASYADLHEPDEAVYQKGIEELKDILTRKATKAELETMVRALVSPYQLAVAVGHTREATRMKALQEWLEKLKETKD